MINKTVMGALAGIGVPVSFQTYDGNESVYITFFEYLQKGEDYSEDEEEITGHYIQVDVWSKGDYADIVNAAKEKLISAGFTRKSEYDLYEPDTKVYHHVIRLFYAENQIGG
ncbi:hypothetical protein SAMN02745945_01824 [Peptoclostridium litorale DSM 5388]|uniref:Uncharacterized protein n=1 Tax=Peptoclostridium litorale DSM 5388 TaxID=1121324 RepID=A0A069RNZ9_PEPLI|nr:hypothetical protein [Peptoclostridium litorale]KDR95902.1 hypothetical protein CLIT_8c00710 [Peptoclostridium litorale DSM 5388]SIO10340.1 hypothetical protein SAMN02745945_01824 [Peptoclostridium litorale DSM 5388]